MIMIITCIIKAARDVKGFCNALLILLHDRKELLLKLTQSGFVIGSSILYLAFDRY